MKKVLNITNGDSAVEIMEKAGIPGDFLPWRDLLHDGPVPDGLSLEALSKVRAKFIIDQGWGPPKNITASFIERDKTLKSFNHYERVILWFEHDLYDQLQILQILDWFDQYRPDKTPLSIICVDQYLGMLTPEEMADLFKYEEPITEKHLALSSRAWSAFRSGNPEKWFELLSIDTTALPFLEGAIIRQLEEYPGCQNGLSRTANQALQIVSKGISKPWEIFSAYQESEERRFLGDTSFWLILQAFLAAPEPLLELAKGQWVKDSMRLIPPKRDLEFKITAIGEAVLVGEKNWLDIVELDCWIGGVHLTLDNIWCWDSDTYSLIKSAKPSNARQQL